ncbi:MAG: hypothetical protein QOD84_2956 [Acidobacteriaceae bacterium]
MSISYIRFMEYCCLIVDNSSPYKPTLGPSNRGLDPVKQYVDATLERVSTLISCPERCNFCLARRNGRGNDGSISKKRAEKQGSRVVD